MPWEVQVPWDVPITKRPQTHSMEMGVHSFAMIMNSRWTILTRCRVCPYSLDGDGLANRCHAWFGQPLFIGIDARPEEVLEVGLVLF